MGRRKAADAGARSHAATFPGAAPLPAWRDTVRVAAVVLSGVFVLLGGLFVLAPEAGAALYGFGERSEAGLFYVRAVGVRDVALAIYLFGLAIAGFRQALRVVALGTLVIPIGDMLLLAASGAGGPVQYLLHAASLMCFAALAGVSARGSGRTTAHISEPGDSRGGAD